MMAILTGVRCYLLIVLIFIAVIIQLLLFNELQGSLGIGTKLPWGGSVASRAVRTGLGDREEPGRGAENALRL